MGKKYDYEYLVIGSGPAGSAAAINLAKAKRHVALVEGRYFGGANINTRDIPYDVALDFSHTYKKALSLPEFKNQDFSFSLPTAVSHQLRAIMNSGGNDIEPYKKAGVTCIRGYANILDNNTIAVGNQRFTAENLILATGAKLKTLEISGTDSVKYLTPETALKLHRSPKAVVIVGGGSTGCEIATYFAELGTKVIILESSSRLLPHEDKEVGELIANYFTRELGIMVLTSSKVVAIEQNGLVKSTIFLNNRSEKLIRSDCIVLATGSEPVLDYGLENAGVKFKNSGITVNRYFETSAKNIYAIGDCLGQASSTDIADYEGTILANNLANKTKNPVNYHGFTRLTCTNPTIATVGYNEDDLIRRDRKYKKALVTLDEIPASKIYDSHYGFIKLIADKTNHIIGATIVAPHAELLTSSISISVRHNLTALELASAPQNLNSYSQLIKLAAKKLATQK